MCFSGDLLLWDLKSGRWQALDTKGGTACHSRVIFNICQGGADNTLVFTTSLDRKVCTVRSDMDGLDRNEF